MSHLADLWRGEFGDRYHARHEERRAEIVERNAAFFELIYEVVPSHVGNVLEFGAGAGLNLMALEDVIGVFDRGDLAGVEVNAGACEEMRKAGYTVYEQSFLDDFQPWEPSTYDLVLTKGVLIHLDEEQLPAAYRALYEASSQYILICEYFAPKREMITYQDQMGICYRDDYAAGLWAAYPDLKFLGSGFGWSKDPEAGQDDLTWFLFEKVEAEPVDGDDD
jgi:spore coat polysaccharide biosynthesis protein SpsF